VKRAAAAVLEEIERCKTEAIAVDELERAKTQCIAAYVFHRQTAEDQAEDVGGNLLGVRDPDFSDRYLEGVRKVTADEVQRVARKYIDRDRMVAAVVRPKEDSTTGATPAAGATETAGKTVKITLPNGLRVLVQRNASSPVVCLQAFCLAGLPAEPEGKNGINNLTAKMLTQGTATRRQAEIYRGLEAVGATIESSGGNNTMGVKVQVLREGLDTAFDIFADVLLNATFPAAEMDKLKTQTVWQIQRNKSDAEEEVVRVFRSRYWKTHPYRRSSEGTPEEIAKITREDAEGYYRKWFVPSNVVVAIFGDVTVEKAKALAEKYLARLAQPAGFAPPAVAPEPPRGAPETAEVESDFGNVHILVGYPAPAMTDDDRFAFSLLNLVVSAGSGNWVHEALRGREEGLVYLAYGSYWPGFGTGYYYIAALTAPEKAERVLALIQEQVQRAIEKGVSADELDVAKRACIVGEALGQQTLAGQAQWSCLSELCGQGFDFPEKYLDKVKAVSVEDVNRMAATYLKNPFVFRFVPKKKPAGGK
jgi:zinc protease